MLQGNPRTCSPLTKEVRGSVSDMIDEPHQPTDPDAPEPEEPVRTGNEAVDGVLDSLASLDDAPVDEHVAVFERAHEQLRAALDSPRDT